MHKKTGFIIAACLLVPVQAFWPIVVLYSLHMFALWPAFPLQDGIHFAAQSLRRENGLAEVPYHTVRVWGTVGYIVPGAVLYFFLQPGKSMTPILYAGVACCILGIVNSFLLPHTPPPPRRRRCRRWSCRGRAPARPRALRRAGSP